MHRCTHDSVTYIVGHVTYFLGDDHSSIGRYPSSQGQSVPLRLFALQARPLK